MDTPTHALIGRLAARSIWPGKDSNRLVNLATVFSIVPDLDIFLPGDSLDRLVTHRGFSHSIVGAFVGALVCAWIWRRIRLRQVPLKTVYGACLLGWLVHILFDLLTSYGTVLFLPASNYRASLDTLFILDPYVDIIVIAGLCLGGFTTLKAKAYRIAAVLLAIYVGLNAAVTVSGHKEARAWSKKTGVDAQRVAVMPTPFSPFHRRVMVEAGEKAYWLTMTPLTGDWEPPLVFDRAVTDPRLDHFWHTREGQIFRWFARYPIIQNFPGRPRSFLVRDLQFMRSREGLGPLGKIIADALIARDPDLFNRWAFSLLVRLAEDGRVESVRFY